MKLEKTFSDDVCLSLAIWTAYLLQGYTRGSGRSLPLLQAELGHFGAVERLARLARLVLEYLSSPQAKTLGDDYPGVIEYEVLEPLGEWFAAHSSAADDAFRQELHVEFTRFMSRRTNAEKPVRAIEPPRCTTQVAAAQDFGRIRKTVMQITMLHPSEEHPEGLSLEDIGIEIDQGGWLGQMAMVSSEAVPAEKLVDEAKALGNDGSFFAYDAQGVPA